jgi:putative ABC transport system permease protein
LASLLPAYAASRVDPLEAMAPLARPPESRVPLAATIAGLACVSIDSLLIFLPTSREVKFYGHFALGLPGQMLGYFLLAPLFVWTFERAGGWLLARLLGLQPALLRQQLSSGIWRAAGTGAALMVGLAILVLMQVQGHSTLQGWRLPNKFPDIFIWSPSGTSLAAEHKLEQTPGIKPGQLLPIAVTNAVIEGEQIELKGAKLVPSVAMFFGIDPNKALDMIELEFRDDNGNTAPPEEQKRLNKLACDELKIGRHLVITDEYRRLLGKKRGDTLMIRTPLHGDVPYTISGVVWSPGIDVIVSMFDMDRQFDQRTATSLFGSLEDASRDFGVDEATFFAANLDMGMDKAKLVEAMQKQAAEVQRATSHAASAPAENASGFLGGAKKLLSMGGPGAATLPATQATGKTAALFNLKQLLGMSGMQAGDVRQIKWQIQNGFERVLLLLSTVAFASMAVAALGVTNTIMASIRSRRWQFGVLRSVGVTRAQLLRLVLAEAMLLGLVGCALGLVAGFQMSWNAHGLARFIVGFVVPMSPPWGLISIAAAIVVLTAVLASIWPAASVARAEPLALLQAGRASA